MVEISSASVDIKNNAVRVPPQNVESERALLGSIMLRPEAMFDAVDVIAPDSFYASKHRIIFSAMLELHNKKEPIDLLSLSSRLREKNQLDAVGGRSYLAEVVSAVPSSTNAKYYAKVVQQKFLLRELLRASDYISELGFDEETEIEELLDRAEKTIFGISGISATQKFVTLKERLTEAWDRLDALHKATDGLRGVPTGFREIDNLLAGLQKSDLVLLAARPSVGKTSLALDIARQSACNHNTTVGVFSLEMSAQQLVDRMLAAESRVDAWKLRTGRLSADSEFLKIQDALGRLSSAPIFIDDTPGNTILKMRSVARRLKREHGLGLLIIDYLQLIMTAKSYDSMVQQVTEISRSLKGLARELDVPVLALSQLSRAIEQRRDKPRLSDLRDSGCLTGDTKIIDAKTGERYSIRALAERKIQEPIEILAMDGRYNIRPCVMSKAFYSGRKMTYLLKTRTGREVKASANHPFLKIDGWGALEELVVGDRIAIPRSLNINTRHSVLKKEELVLLAHLIGDGCVLPNRPYHYTNAYMENIKTVKKAAAHLFGIRGRVVKQENWWHVYLPSPHRLARGKRHPITDWFNALGLERVRSYEKKIPEAVFMSQDDDIELFLRHLWSTDGNVSWKRLRNRAPAGNIYYATSSGELARQVQHLLLRLSIQSVVRPIPSKKEYRMMYHVYVQGAEQQIRFLNRIGIADRRKDVVPVLTRALKKIKQNTNTDTVPVEAWQFVITPAKETLGIGWRGVASRLGLAYNGSALMKTSIGRERLSGIATVLESEQCRNLASSDIFWDEIVSITPLKIEDVYDATVPGAHNFVADDIVVHNSLEQDSDVVMFIHRPDKYKDDAERTNVTEIIVEKHRNGPCGKVELYFDDKRSTFLSLEKDEGVAAEAEQVPEGQNDNTPF